MGGLDVVVFKLIVKQIVFRGNKNKGGVRLLIRGGDYYYYYYDYYYHHYYDYYDYHEGAHKQGARRASRGGRHLVYFRPF